MINMLLLRSLLLLLVTLPVLQATAQRQRHHGSAPAPDSFGSCTPEQIGGAMTSWAGQPAGSEHHETRTISRGTRFTCTAAASAGNLVPSACSLSFQKGGQFTLAPGKTLRALQDGSLTLSCDGGAPTCCRVKVAVDDAALSAEDIKFADQARFSGSSSVGPMRKQEGLPKTLTSGTDQYADPNPATFSTEVPVAVTCLAASGGNAMLHAPACHIDAPGYTGILEVGQTVATSAAGPLTLTCEGQTPLRCSVAVR